MLFSLQLSLGLLSLALSVSAAPAHCPVPTKTPTYPPPPPTTDYPDPPTCDTHICADYVNPCGQWYGGCFLAPECGGTWPTFTAPPCSLTITPTPTPTYPPTPTSTCDVSICVDNINSCSMMYGGCFLAPECGGTWPSFTPPPCPSTTTTTTSACSFSICADYINDCGMMYGGCFLAPECGGTWPSFTPPPCPSTTTTPTYPTQCQQTSTICTDRYNPCEPHNIGTCYLNPACGGTTLEPVNTVCSTTNTAEVTTTVGGYEKVKRVIEWHTWTTTIPEVTPTLKWDYGL